jgi:hypothetical protein
MRRFAARSHAWLVVGTLATLLVAVACGDDAPGDSSGTAGSTANAGGAGISAGGSHQGGSASNSAGELGSAGQSAEAGAGGSADVAPSEAHDLVIYGCTSAGVIAAVQAKHMQKSVILVCPETFLGGLTTQGLGWTDTGDNSVIGGLSRSFYARIKQAYDDDARWKQQTKASYSHYDANADSMWVFEPHVAEEIFESTCAASRPRRSQSAWARTTWIVTTPSATS